MVGPLLANCAAPSEPTHISFDLALPLNNEPFSHEGLIIHSDVEQAHLRIRRLSNSGRTANYTDLQSEVAERRCFWSTQQRSIVLGLRWTYCGHVNSKIVSRFNKLPVMGQL